MALGALTATYVGTAKIDSTALKTLIETVNVGSATAGADTTSLIIIPAQDAAMVVVLEICQVSCLIKFINSI